MPLGGSGFYYLKAGLQYTSSGQYALWEDQNKDF